MITLCSRIAELGRGDLIAEYVETFANVYLQNTSGYNFFTCQTLGIVTFNDKTFIPSFYIFCNKQDRFRVSVEAYWDHLCALEWGWSIERRDGFRKKKLSYKNRKAAERTAKGMQACRYWKDVVAVKNETEEIFKLPEEERLLRQTIFFTKAKLEISLKRVLETIYDRSVYAQIFTDDLSYPESIKLVIEDDIQLRLMVRWTKGIYGVYQLRQFHYTDDNKRQEFIADLINNKTAVIYSGQVSGGFAAKFLEDAKITGVLGEIFIKKTKGSHASLYSDTIDLKCNPVVAKRVRDHLETLEFIDWRHNETDGPSKKVKYRSL